MARHTLIQGDCLDYLSSTRRRWHTVFADPPDNIGLRYKGFKDKNKRYRQWTADVICALLEVAPVVWWSFNAKHTVMMGAVCDEHGLEVKPCVQTFTFGQNRKTDLGNGHRPLWRIKSPETELQLFPDAIKVPSWRELNGDKRAAKGGRVPLDVFDFPRVPGNSKQRRSWHPTQLHEGLVERCLKLTTPKNGRVLDPFGGTGTTLRVSRKSGFKCTLVETSPFYCSKLRAEHVILDFKKL